MAVEIRTVAVVGLGTTGAGIAELFSRNGFDVIAVDADAAGLARGRERVTASLQRAASRDKITAEDADAALARISFVDALEQVAPADLVIEAVPERLDLKKEVLAKLDSVIRPDAVLATSTTALSVTELAVGTSAPRRVVGLQFYTPVPVQPLVEIARTAAVDPAIIDDLATALQGLGKTPVVVGDRAGYITSGLLLGYLNHAVRLFEQKYATREDIDAAMRLGCGLPIGPLALVDLIGLDATYDALNALYATTGDTLHAPAPILKQMVAGGRLGRKSGRGFYSYAQAGSSTVVPDELTPSTNAVEAPVRTIRSVGVVGSGTMATGIMEVFAKSGFDVLYVARGEAKVDAVRAAITKSLDKAVGRGKLTQEARDAALARVSGATGVEALADVDIVVEAVVEDLEVKKQLFASLDEVCKPGAILATTTSSLPVIECAAVTHRPHDVIGMHFFNPATVMKLVEVVSTVSTASDVTSTVVDLCSRIGKHPVSCGDRAGFIVNALLFPYLNDAVALLAQHYASADEIDLAVKSGLRYPMGPFELLDVVGLDVSLAIEKTLYGEFREPGFVPTPLLEQMVTAGYLGRKVGRGFRAY